MRRGFMTPTVPAPHWPTKAVSIGSGPSIPSVSPLNLAIWTTTASRMSLPKYSNSRVFCTLPEACPMKSKTCWRMR